MKETHAPLTLLMSTIETLRQKKSMSETWDSVMLKLCSLDGNKRIVARHPDNWKELQAFIENTSDRPIEIIGTPEAGKTTIVRNLIKRDTSKLFFVIDTHNEYSHLPVITMLEPNQVKENCRFVPFPNIEVSRSQVNNQIVQPLLMHKGEFPANFVLVVEEASRYLPLNFFGSESRKFCKTLLITPNKLFGDGDTLDGLRVIAKVVLPNRHRRKTA